MHEPTPLICVVCIHRSFCPPFLEMSQVISREERHAKETEGNWTWLFFVVEPTASRCCRTPAIHGLTAIERLSSGIGFKKTFKPARRDDG